MICQRCKSTDDVQVYQTDLDEPAEVTLCRICKNVYGTIPTSDGGEVIMYYPESQDEELLSLILEEEKAKKGEYGSIAALARMLKKDPAHLYRVRKGTGNLSRGDREALLEYWRRTHQPSPVFCPAIEDTMPGRKTLILEMEGGEEYRIPLLLSNGRWVVASQ